MTFGAIFGLGFLLIFTAILNSLTDAHQVFAASINGIASTCRNMLATLSLLAAQPMYTKLGIHGAGLLLDFLALGWLMYLSSSSGTVTGNGKGARSVSV